MHAHEPVSTCPFLRTRVPSATYWTYLLEQPSRLDKRVIAHAPRSSTRGRDREVWRVAGNDARKVRALTRAGKSGRVEPSQTSSILGPAVLLLATGRICPLFPMLLASVRFARLCRDPARFKVT